jgi:hypothetical protein
MSGPGLGGPPLDGPALFQETQSFPLWTYALMALVLLVLLSVITLRQVTRVEPGAVTVRYGFLYRTSIPTSDIRMAEAVQYRPVRDYGGWGIRGMGSRRALNTRGNRGVLLTRNDGSTLLIGSQRPRDLLAALANAGVKTEDRLPPETREF